VAAAVVPAAEAPGFRTLSLLKGGIAWINILVLTFLAAPSGGTADFTAGLAVESDELGALAAKAVPDGPEVPGAPRPWVARASARAFSLIAFCFSSSFARIGTRSSGIGPLS
jgi:hypothetical protein